MNARQMLAGLPVRMAEGGPAEARGGPAEVWTPGDSVGRRRAIESGNEAGWLQAVAASADRWMANPGTAAEAYDAMVQSGIGIKDLLDAGVSQATIDQALSIPTPEAQKQVNRLTATSLTNTLAQNPTVAAELASRGAQDVYQQSRQFVENLQKDGLTDDERRYLQQVASQQGWGYSDIRAAGVDPSILFQSYTAPVGGGGGTGDGGTGGGVIGGGGTGGTGSVFPDSLPYTPVTVYDPEKFAREQGADPLYTKGQPALDTAFRESPVRTVSPTTGQYVYTPAATLRPATGSGWSWAPPVVTSRPRQLLDVAPTASASQLYALSRQEQDRALRNAFTAAKIPLGGQDVYSWQSRLRSGDYTSPTGAFDTTRFNQDFESWAAGRGSGTSGTSGQPGAVAYDAMGNPIQPVDPMQLQPKMFLGFADGGDVRARELLDRLKKPEGQRVDATGLQGFASGGEARVGGSAPEVAGRTGRAARLAAQRAEEPQIESRTMLERLGRFTSLDQPQDMSLGETAADIGMGFLPVVGTAQGARDFERARREDDLLGMGLSAASMIPVAGGVIKLGKKGASAARKAVDELSEIFAENPLNPREMVTSGAGATVYPMGDTLRLSDIRTFDPGKGNASQMLRSILEVADKNKVPVELTAQKYSGKGLTTPQLVDWYKRNGFEVVDDFGEDGVDMIRQPRGVAEEIPGAARQMLDEVAPAVRQIDTPEFKNFFGESKVVNEVGQPLVVYHGTNVDLDQFATDIRSGRKRFIPGELGTWFGSTPEVANSFARGVITPRESGVVYPVYLNIQNPKVYDSYEDFLSEMQGRRSASTVKREFQKQGFDGIQIKNSTTDFGGLRDDWVAFKPTQIKSAIGNVGTFDPTNPVVTKKEGGEVTTAELLAQIDRSMANSPASAQGTASSAQPDTVQGDSRSMLRRISDTFGQNVTAPVVGSMLDMTAGVGDLAQLGIKAGAQKLGIETKPFTPVSSAIQESLGVAGYDPYSPAAIATAIGLPAAATLRAAGTAARGSRPLMLNASAPRTGQRKPPAPGSAEELLARLAPIVGREASVFASSELAAMGAREVAPDNLTAEVAAAIAGGGAYNTLDNILSSVAPTTARSQMAEIYRHTPTRENPFVGRIDTYVANLPGRIGRDELLAQMQGKFRNAEILRVRRALEDVDPKAKLQPNEILEKIKQEYDPSDLRVTTIAPGQFREKGLTFYEGMDNPWKGMPPELAPEQGVIVLSRPPVSGVRNYTRGQVRNAEAALSNFNLMVASLNEDMDVDARQQLFNSFSEPLSQALYSLEDFGEDKRGELFVLLDKVGKSAQYAEDIFHLGQRALSRGQDLPPDALNEEKNKLLARGGLEPSQVLDQAYANVFKRKFEKEIAEASGMANFPATRRIIQSLPTPDNVTNAQQASEFLLSTFMPAITREVERARQTQGNLLVGFIEEIRDSGVDKSLRQVIEDSKVPARAGVNPGYVGQHSSLTGTEGGQIGFSRTSDVVASLPNMSYARGIYLHEMQSDLLDDISTAQGRVASGATLTEVKNSIQRLEEKFFNSFKEKAGDSFSNSPEDEEVMERFLRDVLNDPEDRRGTVELYSRTYPQIFSPNLLYWLSWESYKDVLKPLQRARERAEQLEQPEANRRARTGGFSLDEAFPGMMSDSKTLQQMFMKTAVRSAMDRGMNFVALTIPERPYSSQPQLYERVPQNARDVVKDLGEGFRLEQIRMRSPRDYSSNSFPALAITWDQSTAEGREGVNRIMTQGVPFRHGGEVTTQPDDLKNLLSFLDKKPASKRK